ncbi:hypothetical protein CROQUDRAFT_665972 [Cronartium quercuum f. sp. fusiforme G11]|uniref:PEBP-like protein n=1 Tax=Cronartium quercuum f. sp. fusiforme G11 TaxID=708437 RepID=A0A9P6N8V8_9BASI|nr:hypothetical protein CROQUDRAFT_665972 [Cronartium quercuum f. sp. fusiforme G11]
MHSPATVTLHQAIISCGRSAGRLASARASLKHYSTLSQAGPSNVSDSRSSITPNPSLKLPSPIVPPGLIPAYDEAVAFLKQDAEQLALKMKTIESRLTENPRDQGLQKSIIKLEIESQINDVDVRARHKAGLGDMSKAVYRHLKEKAWREAGRLGKTMETVHRLRVFPDILPAISPTVDLTAKFQTTSISVGSFLSAARSVRPPTIRVQAFHPEQQLYTLLMIDPDVPNPSKQSFTTYLHWLVPNIPISALESDPLDLSSEVLTNQSLAYVPPHPARGSSLHRYTLLLLKQPAKLESLPSITRRGFSARQWVQSTKMEAAGVLSWQSKWREQEAGTITRIYETDLKCPEPVYGRIPKPLSGRTRLPAYTPLPLTHRHPPVIEWQRPAKLTSSDV